MTDHRVWNVLAYPTGEIIHTAETYEAAAIWRLGNNQSSVVLPRFSDDSNEGEDS